LYRKLTQTAALPEEITEITGGVSTLQGVPVAAVTNPLPGLIWGVVKAAPAVPAEAARTAIAHAKDFMENDLVVFIGMPPLILPGAYRPAPTLSSGREFYHTAPVLSTAKTEA
jgi:hypothetical protein